MERNIFEKFNGLSQTEQNYNNFVSLGNSLGYEVTYGEEYISLQKGADCFVLDYCYDSINVRHVEVPKEFII